MHYVDDNVLSKIGNFMLYQSSPTSETMEAGLTYIGQMISHDIVPPTSPKRGRRLVTPLLNLDSIYGTKAPPKRFIVRKVKDKVHNITNYDLYRRKGVALIPEHRNDENVIVSQLHAFWQRLHNHLVKNAKVSVEEAQVNTIKTFQLMVIEEFLRKLIDPQVYKAYFIDNRRFMPERITNQIPTFFSHAAFRLGHSMIRPSYKIRDYRPETSLSNLFNGGKALPTELALNWNDFFSHNGSAQKGMKVDLGISRVMSKVKFPLDAPTDINVIFNNLKAGEFSSLPNGHGFCDFLLSYNHGNKNFSALGLKKHTQYNDGLIGLQEPTAEHHAIVNIESLPLWPYILAESQMGPYKGNHLGVLGSILVADVLQHAIRKSPISVYSGKDYYLLDNTLNTMGEWGRTLRNLRVPDSKSGITMASLISIIN